MRDQRFQKLQFNRSRKLAAVLLCVFVVLLLLINRFAYPIWVGWNPMSLEFWVRLVIRSAVGGVIVAEVCLLTIWISMAYEPLGKRLGFFLAAVAALGAAWMLGFAAMMDTTQNITWFESEEISASGFLPTVFLATSLPLIGLRFFGYYVVAVDPELTDSKAPTRSSVTILSLILTTMVVAVVLGGIGLTIKRMSVTGMPQSEIWIVAGFLAAWAFGIGLLILLPAVLLLFSNKRNFAALSMLTFFIVPLIVWLAHYLIFGSGPSNSQALSASIAAIIVLLVGIWIMRLFGYRLTKTIKAIQKTG